MLLEIAKLVLLLAVIAILQPWGVRAAAAAVGIAFGLTSVAAVAMVIREGPSMRRLLVGFLQPLTACGIMGAAVYGTWRLLELLGLDHPAIQLTAMIAVGAIAYVISALV